MSAHKILNKLTAAIMLLVFCTAMMLCAGPAAAKENIVKLKKVYSVDFKKTPSQVNTVFYTANGDIEARAWDKSGCGITVHYEIPASSEQEAKTLAENTIIRYASGTLTVSLQEFFKAYEKKSPYFKKRSASAKIIIYLPKGITYRLNCDTSNGDIFAKDLKCSEAVLDTSNGDVSIENISAKNINADTSNGDITFKGTASAVNFDTSNGGINVNALSVQGVSSYKLNTSTGDITVTVPKGAAVKIDKADTSTGEVTADIEGFNISNKNEYKEDKNTLKGETANFSKAINKIIILAQTSTGDIEIK